MIENLTELKVRNFKTNGTLEIKWDSQIRGFGCRIYPSGRKSYMIAYQYKGKRHLYSIGNATNIELKKARQIARKLFGDIADNINPIEKREKQKRKDDYKVEKVFQDFMIKYSKNKNRSWREVERIFEKDVLYFIGKKYIEDVKREDIVKILDIIQKRNAGVMANRTLAHIRKFFNWCVERGIIKSSPAYKIPLPSSNPKRDRVLTDIEIKKIWNASSQIGYPFGDIIKFLFLTGQRRGEVASMLFSEYDSTSKVWTIPKEKTKSNRENYIFISKTGEAILNDVSNIGEYCFSDTGINPFNNFSRDKKKLDELISMNDWRIHDIRRTVASGMARMAIEPYVIERILNHSDGIISGVAAVYNRYKYEKETKEALEKWGEYLDMIVK